MLAQNRPEYVAEMREQHNNPVLINEGPTPSTASSSLDSDQIREMSPDEYRQAMGDSMEVDEEAEEDVEGTDSL